MQIEALKIYCDVARFRSFSRGAEANDVLQSSASQAVQNIEENLGVSLIDRSCRPWELTDEGKLFYDGCREVLEKYEDVVARVKHARASGNSVIRIAAIYSVNMRDMTQRVQDFMRAQADTKVEVEYAHPARVLERVLNDEVELGIISYPDERRGLTVLPWREQEMVLVCTPQHRLAKLKSVEVKQLRNEIFVGFDTDLVIAKKIERFLKDHGLEPNVAVRLDNIRDTVKNAGFTIGDTNVSVRGSAVKEGEQWRFQVEGSDQPLRLKAPFEATGVTLVQQGDET